MWGGVVRGVGSRMRLVEGGGVGVECIKMGNSAYVIVLDCNSVVFDGHIDVNTIV